MYQEIWFPSLAVNLFIQKIFTYQAIYIDSNSNKEVCFQRALDNAWGPVGHNRKWGGDYCHLVGVGLVCFWAVYYPQ